MRRACNLTNMELRHLPSGSTATIAKPDHGNNVTTDIFLCLADALNCEVIDLFETTREVINNA